MNWVTKVSEWEVSFHTRDAYHDPDGAGSELDSDSEEGDEELDSESDSGSESDEEVLTPEKINRELSLKFYEDEPVLSDSRFDFPTGSNFWKIKARAIYTIKQDFSNSSTIHGCISKKFDYRNIDEMNKFKNINTTKILLVLSPDSQKPIYAFVTAEIREERGCWQNTTFIKKLSLLEKTEGFSDVEFIFDNGEKLYGNRETLSTCSPVLEKLLEKNQRDSFVIGNVEFEDFHACLRMVHPNCKQDFDENRVVAIMQLGAAYEVPGVMGACENILLSSKKEYSDDELHQIMHFAEKYNLNQLMTWCYAEMDNFQSTFVTDEAALLAKAEENARIEVKLMMASGEDYIRSFQGMLGNLGNETDHEDDEVENEANGIL